MDSIFLLQVSNNRSVHDRRPIGPVNMNATGDFIEDFDADDLNQLTTKSLRFPHLSGSPNSLDRYAFAGTTVTPPRFASAPGSQAHPATPQKIFGPSHSQNLKAQNSSRGTGNSVIGKAMR